MFWQPEECICTGEGFAMKEDMKLLISDTFTQMLEKEDIDKITVTKLIEKCHISRQTFYYHFQDIMDVLDWTFRRGTQELAQESLNILEAEGRAAALQVYVAFVRKNRVKFEKLLYSRRWVEIENLLVESVMMYLREVAQDRLEDLAVSYDDMEVMLRFYACGMVGVLMQYAGKKAPNEEKLVRQIERIITGNMFPAKDR